MSSSLDSFEVSPALGSKVDLVRTIDQTAPRVAVDVAHRRLRAVDMGSEVRGHSADQ